MLEIKDLSIYLTRGDSAYITLNPLDGNGEPYALNDDDTVSVQVRTKPNIGDLVFEGCIEMIDGNIVWHIKPEDTRGNKIGKYYYDAQLNMSNGDVFTFIPVSLFYITDEVTMRSEQ